MAHTALHTFFHDCARRDLLAAQHAYEAADYLHQARDIAIQCNSYMHGQRDSIKVPMHAISACSAVAFNTAGEAVKQLKRTRPDLIAAYPDFPWDAFKRIRDESTHIGRSFIDSQNAMPNTSIRENYLIIDEFFRAVPRKARPKLTDDPLVVQIGNAWDVVSLGMDIIRQHVRTGPLPASPWISIHRQDTRAFKRFSPGNYVVDMFPLMLTQNVMRHAMNQMGDALNEMSPFLREYSDLPFEPRAILAVRNRLAHFTDTPDSNRYGVTRYSSETERSLAALMPNIEKVKQFARPFALTSMPPEKHAAVTNKLAEIYEQNVLGTIRPERAGILNDTAEFICSSRKNDPALRVAVVKAMAGLLKLRTADDCQEVLDYMKSNRAAIRSPAKMRAQIDGVSQATRACLNAYLREVVELSSPLGEGLGRVHA